MGETTVFARRWGNSIGIAIPAKLVEKEKISANDKVIISVKKIAPIKSLFGTLKTKRSAQAIKNMLREEWN